MTKRIFSILSLTLILGTSLYAVTVNVLPTGNGSSAPFIAVGGDGAVWEAVDDPVGACDGDTTYGVLLAANGTHFFTFPAPNIPAGSTIDSVQITSCNEGIGSNWIFTPVLRVGGANFNGTTATVFAGGGYAEVVRTWATNPATTATWTLAEVNGTAGSNNLEEFASGVTSNTTAGDEARVSQVYMTINFTAGSIAGTRTLMLMGAGR